MTVLVTGGNGLLGRPLVRMLLERGEDVRVFDLTPSEESGVESIVGDLRDRQAVETACAGVDTVYHVASLVNLSLGKPQIVYDVNVKGTQHILDACRKYGAKKLIYTSSIDVVFDGTPIVNGDESLPYPTRYLDYYGETKALAEQAVIAANGKDGLLTCSLRAVGIYGPHDKQRFPALIKQAKSGRMIRIGSGKSRFSHAYADNIAHAHILAAAALTADSPVAGSVYFITDQAPSNFFEFVHHFLEPFGMVEKVQTIPCWVVRFASTFAEWRYRLLPIKAFMSPLITRYVAASVCTDFFFQTDKAERDFGYRPIVDTETAYQRTVEWLKTQIEDR